MLVRVALLSDGEGNDASSVPGARSVGGLAYARELVKTSSFPCAFLYRESIHAAACQLRQCNLS